MAINHSKVSAIPDEADTDLIRPSDWNAQLIGTIDLANTDSTTDVAVTGVLQAAQFPALTGDITTVSGSLATILATVNSNIGAFGSSTAIPSLTVNAKGLVTAVSTNVVIAPAGTLTGTTLASNVVTSSLTTIGTLVAGSVPFSLVTGTVPISQGGTNSTSQVANGICFANSGATAITSSANLVYNASTNRVIQTDSGTPGSIYLTELSSGLAQWIVSYGSLTTKTSFCNSTSVSEYWDVATGSGSTGALVLTDTLLTFGTSTVHDVRFIRNSERIRIASGGVSICNSNLAAVGTDALSIGTVAATPTFLGKIYTVDETSTPGKWYADQYNASASAFSGTQYRKARGTFASPTDVASGDTLGVVEFYGYAGSFVPGASIAAIVQSTVGTNDLPTSLIAYVTNDGASTSRVAWRAGYDGIFTTYGTAGTATFYAASGEHIMYSGGSAYLQFTPAFGAAVIKTYASSNNMSLQGTSGGYITDLSIYAVTTTVNGKINMNFGSGINLNSGASTNFGSYAIHTVSGGSYPIRISVDSTDSVDKRTFEVGAYASNNPASTWTPTFTVRTIDGLSYFGTTIGSSASKLTVTSDAVYGSNVHQLQLQGASNTNKVLQILYDTSSNVGVIQGSIAGSNYSNLHLNPSAANVGIGVPVGTSVATILHVMNQANSAVYAEATKIAVTNNSGGTNYSRMLFGQNQTNAMFIEAADQSNTKGTLLLQPFGGYVSIGTISATNLLTLGTVNSNYGEILRINGSNAQNYVAWYNNTTRQGYIGTYTSGNGLIINGDANGLYLQSGSGTITALNYLQVQQNVTAGYVPGVYGGVYLTGSYQYGKPAIQGLNPAAGADALYINPIGGGVVVNSTTSLTALTLNLSTNNDGMSINQVTASKQAYLSFFDNGTLKWLIGKQTDNSWFMYDAASARDFLRVVSGNILLNPSGGDVGVGVSPVAKFQVSASVGLPSSYANYGILMYDSGSASASYGLGINSSTLWYNSHSHHVWYSSAAEVMRIYGTNVGVNSTNPQGKFSICGSTADNQSIEFGYTGSLTANYMESVNRNGDTGVDFVSFITDNHAWRWYTNATARMRLDAGLQVGAAPTGGDKGTGTINVATAIYLNNTAYTNPDYAFEHYFNKGKIVKYKDNPGAKDYKGLMALDKLKSYVKNNYRFPNINNEPACIFERGDTALELIEEAYLHMFEMNERLTKLEKNLH